MFIYNHMHLEICMQGGLQLTQEQRQTIIGARKQLLFLMASIRQRRERIVIGLGLALIQNQLVRTYACMMHLLLQQP